MTKISMRAGGTFENFFCQGVYQNTTPTHFPLPAYTIDF